MATVKFPFTKAGQAELKTVHPKLQELANDVSNYFNCSILDGARTIEQQRKNVASGLSQTMQSKHLPASDGYSHALDIAIYPQNWNDTTSPKMSQWEVDQVYFMGFMMGMAAERGLHVRYGGDWNSDGKLIGQGFRDLDHVELVDD